MTLWTRRSPILRLLGAVAALLLLSTFLHPGSTSHLFIGPLVGDKITTNVKSNGHHRPSEMDGLALGSKFTRPLDTQPTDDIVAWLMASLRSRFRQTLFPDATGAPSYPKCTLFPERYAKTTLEPAPYRSRWWNDPRRSIVSFAINLHNSEAIIPAQAIALLEAIVHLMQHNKVYVSIYENGSEDKTRALLSDFGAALEAIGVDGFWIHSSKMLSDFGKHDRIVTLAVPSDG
jgi:hypothetical protein